MEGLIELLCWTVLDEKNRIGNKARVMTFCNSIDSCITIQIADGRSKNGSICLAEAKSDDIGPVFDAL